MKKDYEAKYKQWKQGQIKKMGIAYYRAKQVHRKTCKTRTTKAVEEGFRNTIHKLQIELRIREVQTAVYKYPTQEDLKDRPIISMKALKEDTTLTKVLDDAEEFKLDSKFDYITASYLPKYCDPEVLVRNCINHLKPGGKIIFHDFTYPKNLVVRGLWNILLTLLRLMGYFIPSWRYALIGLPKLIRSTTWLDSYSNVMEKSGLKIGYQYLTYGVSAILTGIK